LHFSPRSEKSLEVTLSLNGIPVATLELKNSLTGQTVEEARLQYMQNRNPREPIFEFKRWTLVHFAIDTEAVFMTTRLAGTATHFLPFNKGCDGGVGNPPDPAGRTYRTAYLWEEVLQRDSFLDLLARFVHLQSEEKRDDQGRKVKRETMIFPRYHQLRRCARWWTRLGARAMEELFRSMAKRGRQANLGSVPLLQRPSTRPSPFLAAMSSQRTATPCGRRSRKGLSSTC
jgi:type I site-specific restriction-modification system R (restriction) subunit